MTPEDREDLAQLKRILRAAHETEGRPASDSASLQATMAWVNCVCGARGILAQKTPRACRALLRLINAYLRR